MKKLILAAAIAYALAHAAGAAAQPGGRMEVAETEAVITVTKVDQATRVVTFRGPRGELSTFQVPAASQNLDQVKPGARFKVRYVEALAVEVQRGGTPSSAVAETMQLAPKGGNPGGVMVKTAQLAGVVEAIDYSNRYIAVRGPKSNVLALKVASDVKLEELNVGDRISLTHTQALAMEMIPQGATTKQMK